MRNEQLLSRLISKRRRLLSRQQLLSCLMLIWNEACLINKFMQCYCSISCKGKYFCRSFDANLNYMKQHCADAWKSLVTSWVYKLLLCHIASLRGLWKYKKSKFTLNRFNIYQINTIFFNNGYSSLLMLWNDEIVW